MKEKKRKERKEERKKEKKRERKRKEKKREKDKNLKQSLFPPSPFLLSFYSFLLPFSVFLVVRRDIKIMFLRNIFVEKPGERNER